jgi:hypothetical protein
MVAVVCGRVPQARAQSHSHDSQESLIRQGVELRKRGNDQKAEEYFRSAYQLAATPRAAAQLGLVEFALDRFDEAQGHLSEALATHDAWVDEHRKILEESRAEVRKHLVQLEIVGAPPRATIAVGAGPQSPLPADGKLWLAPGAISLRIKAPGRNSIVRKADTSAGEHMIVDVTPSNPEPTAAPPPPLDPARSQPVLVTDPRAPERGKSLRIAGIATGAVGVGLAVTGIIFYRIAGDKLEHLRSPQGYGSSDLDWQTFDRGGVALMVGGGAAVAAGAVMYVVGAREREPSPAQVSLKVGSHGGFLSVGRAF